MPLSTFSEILKGFLLLIMSVVRRSGTSDQQRSSLSISPADCCGDESQCAGPVALIRILTWRVLPEARLSHELGTTHLGDPESAFSSCKRGFNSCPGMQIARGSSWVRSCSSCSWIRSLKSSIRSSIMGIQASREKVTFVTRSNAWRREHWPDSLIERVLMFSHREGASEETC